MKISDYSHRHGRELVELLHSPEYNEILNLFSSIEPFHHGETKNQTPVNKIAQAFTDKGWEPEKKIPLSKGKSDFCDLYKNKLYVEQEYSKFETLFRDFFRFILLEDKGELDVGIIVCYDEAAFGSWGAAGPSYGSSRATLQRAVDFLKGDYGTVVRVPIWVIGIE